MEKTKNRVPGSNISMVRLSQKKRHFSYEKCLFFIDLNFCRTVRYVKINSICADALDMLPYGNEKKAFIAYRNRTKWDYIEFAKQIYRTNDSEYIA